MKTLSFTRPLLLSLSLATAMASAAEEVAIKFSNPDKPRSVRVAVGRGEVRILPSQTPDVVVKSDDERKPARPSKGGLRVLTESAPFSMTEKDNVVTIEAGAGDFDGPLSELTVMVPKGAAVTVESHSGAINCANIAGDLEIRTRGGHVILENVTGAAVVEATNGRIEAGIREIQEGKPLSFTSHNGAVVLRVPPAAKANVRLRTQNGVVETDFDEKALVTKLESVSFPRGHAMITREAREKLREAARATVEATRHAAEAFREAAESVREGAQESLDRPLPPIPPGSPAPMRPFIPTLTGGKLVTGTLNSGGPEISVTTMNGNITLLKSER